MKRRGGVERAPSCCAEKSAGTLQTRSANSVSCDGISLIEKTTEGKGTVLRRGRGVNTDDAFTDSRELNEDRLGSTISRAENSRYIADVLIALMSLSIHLWDHDWTSIE